ncbi:carbohydrate deacetylase [Carnobacterium gallinarum]|uniref:carbohydrate deacetylase n=1 Tax=Carnobacterium gallinarum TaxID=2749 RepID=UPI0005519ECB|nr:carbohydrate deacetylase [Carnobacterium gallinarum]
MKKVIINADDFGYSSAVNGGIIQAFKKGILSSTTLMANMPGCDEAIELAKKNPTLGVGGHLVLTCGKALTSSNSLVDSEGKFFKLNEYKKYRSEMKDEEIFNEWSCQIEYLINNGVELTHLDSHHHVHTFSENLEITKRIAEKYHLAFRNAFDLENQISLPYQKGIKGFDDLMNEAAIRDMSSSYHEKKDQCLDEIKVILERIEEQEITELMVHPAFVDEMLYFNSSFNLARMREVEILSDPEVEKLFKSYEIEIVCYRDVAIS